MTADWPAAGGSVTAHGEVITVLAAGPRRDVAVLRVDLGTSPATVTELTPQPTVLPDPAYLPVPQERVFTDPQGRDVPRSSTRRPTRISPRRRVSGRRIWCLVTGC